MLDVQASPSLPRFAFGKYDEVILDGISYRATDCSDDGYIFVRTDASDVAQSFSHADLSRRVTNGTLEHRRDEFLPQQAKRRLRQPARELSTLSLKTQRKAKYHEALVLAFLEMEKEGKVKRTEDATKDALDEIKFRAGKYYSIPSEADGGQFARNTRVSPEKVSASRLLKRVAAYSRDGLSALYGQDIQNRRERRIGPDELCLLTLTIRNYLSPERPSIADIVDDVSRAFRAENLRRKTLIGQGTAGEGSGQPTSYLVPPSRETIRREINKLDPFEVVAARHGLDAARKKFAPVGTGMTLTRALERVEMDAWKVDLKTIMSEAGIWSMLDEEEKAAFGLEAGKKTRWFLVAAMYATTRCIVAMKLTRAEKQPCCGADDRHDRARQRALDGCRGHSDPLEHVRHSGAHRHGCRVRVHRFRHTCRGDRSRHQHRRRSGRNARVPWQDRTDVRHDGRQLHRTLHGANIQQHSRQGRLRFRQTSCTDLGGTERSSRALGRGRLSSSSARRPWRRNAPELLEPPRRQIWRRSDAVAGAQPEGAGNADEVHGHQERYHDPRHPVPFKSARAMVLRAQDLEVRVRWYSEDLGAIAVELDGEWVEIPSVLKRFRGQRASVWLRTVREIRAAYAAEAAVSEAIIARKMDHIVALNGNAMARQGLFVEDFSEERLKKLEDTLMIGFRIEDTPCEANVPTGEDGLGIDLPTRRSPGAGYAQPEASSGPETRDAPVLDDVYDVPDLDDDWSIGEK